MSSEEVKPEVPVVDTLIVNKVRFIQGVNALTVLYNETIQTLEECREKVGDEHNATRQAYETVRFIGGLVSHFTDLITLDDEQLSKQKTLN